MRLAPLALAPLAFFVALAHCGGDDSNTTDAGTDAGMKDTGMADNYKPPPPLDSGPDMGTDSGPACPPASGAYLWHKVIPGAHDASGVATDSAGNTYAVGSFSGMADFEIKKLNATGGDDLYVMQLDAMGIAKWAVAYGGMGNDVATSIAVGPSGDLYVSGSFDSASIDFGKGPLASGGQQAGFVAKLSATDGSAEWAVAFTESSGKSVHCPGIAASATNVAVGCDFDGATLQYGKGSVMNHDTGKKDLAVMALDPSSGAASWGNGIGVGGADDVMGRMGIDESGDFLVAATVAGGMVGDTLGTLTVSAPGSSGNALYARLLQGNGHRFWVNAWGGNSGPTTGAGVSGFSAGTVAVFAGRVSGSTMLGMNSVMSAGADDAYVFRYDQTMGKTVWTKLFGGTSSTPGEGVVDLATDFCANSFVTGELLSTDATLDSIMIGGPPKNSVGMFTAKLSPTGKGLWAVGISPQQNPNEYVKSLSVAVTPKGEVRVGGTWKGTSALDGSNYENTPNAGMDAEALIMAYGP